MDGRPSRPKWEEWKQNLLWGTTWGLSLGVLYSALVAIATLIRGPAHLHAMGVSLPEVLSVYLGGGLFGGLVVGFLRPLTAYRMGAIAIGVLVFVPFMFTIISMLIRPEEREIAVWGGLISGVGFGVAFGWSLWSEYMKD